MAGMFPKSSPSTEDGPSSVTQSYLDHLSARYDAVSKGTGAPPSMDEIKGWERVGQQVEKLKAAYGDAAKRGLTGGQ